MKTYFLQKKKKNNCFFGFRLLMSIKQIISVISSHFICGVARIIAEYTRNEDLIQAQEFIQYLVKNDCYFENDNSQKCKAEFRYCKEGPHGYVDCLEHSTSTIRIHICCQCYSGCCDWSSMVISADSLCICIVKGSLNEDLSGPNEQILIQKLQTALFKKIEG